MLDPENENNDQAQNDSEYFSETPAEHLSITEKGDKSDSDKK